MFGRSREPLRKMGKRKLTSPNFDRLFSQNVYVTHRTGTDSQPPTIGLLGITDPGTALAAFIRERGQDPLPRAYIRSNPPGSSSLTGGEICGIATAGGFVGGVLIIVLVFTCIAFRRKC